MNSTDQIIEIAAILDLPNEWLKVTQTGNHLFISVKDGQQYWTVKTGKSGRVLKNSLRRDS
jgi:hypothetical protein